MSVAAWRASLPVAYRLCLREEWARDRAQRRRAGLPEHIELQSKPVIIQGMILRAREHGVPEGVVPTVADYGADTGFRGALGKLGLQYVVGFPRDGERVAVG